MEVTLELKDRKHSCRICLSRDAELHSMIDSETSLCQIISFAVGAKFELDDDLPKSICSNCYFKANIAFDFKKKFQESDRILQELLKIHEIKIEKEEFNNDANMVDDSISYNEEKPDLKEEYSLYSPANSDIEDFEDHGIVSYCPLCGVCCENSSNLNKHILKVHKNLIHSSKRNKSLNHVYKLDIKVPKVKHEISLSKKKDKMKEIHNKLSYKVSGSFCPLCDASFVNSYILTEHMWQKHKKFMWPLKKRKYRFCETLEKVSENGLKITKLAATRVKCVICNKSIIKTKRRDHYVGHNNKKIYKCNHCKKMFLEILKYEQHKCMNDRQRIQINENSEVPNENLTNIHLDETTLQTLLSDEKMIQPYICKRCGVICVSEINLSKHNKQDHLTCQQCFKVFTSIKSINRHLRICKGNKVKNGFVCLDMKSYQCNECDEIFDNKKDIILHFLHLHKPNIMYECDICKKTFNRKDNLRSHKRVHDPVKKLSKTVLCRYCGLYIAVNNLTIHMRRHTGVKPFKCKMCDKCFISPSDLKRHTMMHTGEKPHMCKLCGKCFGRNSQLVLHMRVHTGHKPYKCSYCDRAFTQSNDLRLHIRRHTGEKPYVCDVCGERFVRGTTLKNHRLKSGHILPVDKN